MPKLTRRQKDAIKNSSADLSDAELARRLRIEDNAVHEYRLSLSRELIEPKDIPRSHSDYAGRMVGAAALVLMLAVGGYAVSSFSARSNTQVVSAPSANQASSLDDFLDERIAKYTIQRTINKTTEPDEIPGLTGYSDALARRISAMGLKYSDIALDSFEYVSATWAKPFSSSDHEFVEAAQVRLKSSINDFSQFYSEAVPGLEYELVVPKEVNEIDALKVDGKVALYLVKEQGIYTITTFKLRTKDGRLVSVPFTNIIQTAGNVPLKYDFKNKDDRTVLDQVELHPVLVGYNKLDAQLDEAGVAELLHRHLVELRVDRIRADLSRYQNNSPISPEIAQGIIGKRNEEEEGAVHGATLYWMMQRGIYTAQEVQGVRNAYASLPNHRLVLGKLGEIKDKAQAVETLKRFIIGN